MPRSSLSEWIVVGQSSWLAGYQEVRRETEWLTPEFTHRLLDYRVCYPALVDEVLDDFDQSLRVPR